jgi:hypothetical protein
MSGGGGAPACGEGKGQAGEVRWGTGELMALLVWEGRARRSESRYGPSWAALMEEVAAVGRTRAGLAAFIGNWGEGRESRRAEF